jgi:serine/threonine-protein kinase
MDPVGNDETVAGGPQTETRHALVEAEAIADRYRVVRWLGGGGMGNVYHAIDSELGEPVALKVLGGGLTDDAIERFRREVRLTRRIRHENVARMFDIGEHRGSRFLTMELIDGAALSNELGAAMPWVRLQAIAQQICAGLAAAHDEGVIHRDLKPDNVLVERTTGRAVVTDFGIARSQNEVAVTQVGEVIGTPRYMAPEQLAGDEADERSDLFSLGVMLFELATATRPWAGKTAAAFANSDCPQAFIAIVERCLSLLPSDRPANAREVEDAIARCEVGGATQIDRRAAPPDADGSEGPTSRQVPQPRVRRSSLEVPTQPAKRAPITVAVMPFASTEADAYLADAMVEDLIDTLSTSETLRVRPVGPGSHEGEVRELGRRLGVDHVVSGSVRRIPSGLRIAARLTSVGDGFQIWAHRADVVEAEVLTAADKLATEIATAMSTRATAGDRPTDPRAVELYLRARAQLRQYWGTHVLAATDLLEEAVALAPTSPPILGAYAFAAAQAWLMRGGTNNADRARDAIDRALAYGHGDAYLASSVVRVSNGDPVGGAADLAMALARAPMSPHAHEYAGRLLSEIAPMPEARFHFETAAQLDPGRAPVILVELSRLDALEGHWELAFARIVPLVGAPELAIAQFAAMYEARLHGWHRDRAAMTASATRHALRSGENSTEILTFVRRCLEQGGIEAQPWTTLCGLFASGERPQRASLLGFQILAEIAGLFDDPDRVLEAMAGGAAIGLVDLVWIDRCPLFAELDTARLRPIRDQVAANAARVLAAYRSASATPTAPG